MPETKRERVFYHVSVDKKMKGGGLWVSLRTERKQNKIKILYKIQRLVIKKLQKKLMMMIYMKHKL